MVPLEALAALNPEHVRVFHWSWARSRDIAAASALGADFQALVAGGSALFNASLAVGNQTSWQCF